MTRLVKRAFMVKLGTILASREKSACKPMPLLSDTTNSSIKDDDDDDSFDNNQCKGDCATVTSGDV